MLLVRTPLVLPHVTAAHELPRVRVAIGAPLLMLMLMLMLMLVLLLLCCLMLHVCHRRLLWLLLLLLLLLLLQLQLCLCQRRLCCLCLLRGETTLLLLLWLRALQQLRRCGRATPWACCNAAAVTAAAAVAECRRVGTEDRGGSWSGHAARISGSDPLA
jgi:hypothetical protein